MKKSLVKKLLWGAGIIVVLLLGYLSYRLWFSTPVEETPVQANVGVYDPAIGQEIQKLFVGIESLASQDPRAQKQYIKPVIASWDEETLPDEDLLLSYKYSNQEYQYINKVSNQMLMYFQEHPKSIYTLYASINGFFLNSGVNYQYAALGQLIKTRLNIFNNYYASNSDYQLLNNFGIDQEDVSIHKLDEKYVLVQMSNLWSSVDSDVYDTTYGVQGLFDMSGNKVDDIVYPDIPDTVKINNGYIKLTWRKVINNFESFYKNRAYTICPTVRDITGDNVTQELNEVFLSDPFSSFFCVRFLNKGGLIEKYTVDASHSAAGIRVVKNLAPASISLKQLGVNLQRKQVDTFKHIGGFLMYNHGSYLWTYEWMPEDYLSARDGTIIISGTLLNNPIALQEAITQKFIKEGLLPKVLYVQVDWYTEYYAVYTLMAPKSYGNPPLGMGAGGYVIVKWTPEQFITSKKEGKTFISDLTQTKDLYNMFTNPEYTGSKIVIAPPDNVGFTDIGIVGSDESLDIETVKMPLFTITPCADPTYIVIWLSNLYEGRITGLGKPVIYVYDKYNRDNEVTLITKGQFTFLDPYFNQKMWWNFQTHDGKVIVEGQSFDYLRYKVTVKNYSYNTQWWIIDGIQAKKFFTDKLTVMGLTSKEKNDFLDYRVSKYEVGKQYFVSFKFNEQLDPYVQLQFKIKPNAQFRVLMETTELNNDTLPIFQKWALAYSDDTLLKTFKRSGELDVLEWWGVFNAPNNGRVYIQ